MHPAMKDPAFQIYAICTVVLAVKMLAVGNWTGLMRVRTRSFVNPEDRKPGTPPAAEVEHPSVQRAHRAHRNDLENIPIFLIIALLYVMAGGSATGTRAYCITFTAARVMHSVVYLAGKQPWRTISFILGSICIAGMAVQLIMWAIAA
jgi:uncharacterized MAPEG superfamily protein